jgi:hypothetical protein
MEAIKTILRDDGIKGFWRGTVMRLGRTVCSGGELTFDMWGQGRRADEKN